MKCREFGDCNKGFWRISQFTKRCGILLEGKPETWVPLKLRHSAQAPDVDQRCKGEEVNINALS